MLDTIASDPGLQQTELVFLGLFGRACRVLEGRDAQARPPLPDSLGTSCPIPCAPALLPPCMLSPLGLQRRGRIPDRGYVFSGICLPALRRVGKS